MEFVPLVVLTSAVKKLVDTVKYAANGDINAVVTQLVAWALGILVTWISSQAELAHLMEVNGVPIANLDGWSLVVAGIALASTAGIGYDALKAIDGSNSAIIPNLLGRVHTRQGTPASTEPVSPT
jgi:hypothetical protein